MDCAARLRRAPAAARRPPSRPAPGTAVSGPGAVLALQRAVGNQAVAALLGQPALQRADDVFDSKHFTDPVAYLHSRPGQPAVVEDSGSAGITGRPDRALITELADPATRAQYRGGLIGQRDQAALDKQNYDQQSLTATDAQRPQILVQARETGTPASKSCAGV